ncbi:MAG TPA: radical SAM protein, partial [Syntrophothermus lipocalidus]|nr:radical SAM protein [Syntrophothermus lipocalidus]
MLHRIIPIFIPHLGCPHRCVFCQQYRITGSEKPPSPAAVAGMIESGLQKTGASGPEPVEVAFYGGSFTSLPVQVIEGYLKAV